MQTVSYTEARNKLAALMDSASHNRDAISITRNGKGSVVMMAMEEFESMQATLHLLSTPSNADRIRQGLEDFKNRKYRVGKLCD